MDPPPTPDWSSKFSRPSRTASASCGTASDPRPPTLGRQGGTVQDKINQLGLVVHPRRSIDDPRRAIRDWAAEHRVGVGQIPIPGQPRRIAETVEVASCDLLLAVGGDGTTLAALHAAAPTSRPVLGVACGSIGLLTSVNAGGVSSGLDQVAAGSWTARVLPGLEIAAGNGDVQVAINDFAVIRSGIGQVITAITVDGELYVGTAGDGVGMATPLGSSAYTMAAGGPILAPPGQSMVVTALAPHGGGGPPPRGGPARRVG